MKFRLTRDWLFLVSFLLKVIAFAQPIQFADPNFKSRLMQSGTCGIGSVVNEQPSGGYIMIDSNNNGQIEQIEAQQVTYLNININGSPIINLSGLEYFNNLKFFVNYDNPITFINISSLTQLEYFFIWGTQLTTIDFTGLYNLKQIQSIGNPITSFDFSGLPNLEFVACNNNLMTSLDFTNNPLFNRLFCPNNSLLTTIKIKNGTNQVFPLSNYCLFNGNPNLAYICADASEIPIIQAFQATCSVNQACVIDSACSSLGTKTHITTQSFSIAPNPSNGLFTVIFDTPVPHTTIEVYNLLGQKVYNTMILNSMEHELNLSHLPNGTYIAKVTHEGLITSKRILKI